MATKNGGPVDIHKVCLLFCDLLMFKVFDFVPQVYVYTIHYQFCKNQKKSLKSKTTNEPEIIQTSKTLSM